MSEWSIPVNRGCGYRIEGGVYWDLGMSRYGKAVEDFLIDPPKIVDLDALGVTPRGVHLIEKNGVWHILDWVGAENYPNVADMVEEIRRFGLSRRLSDKLDFSKLTKDSRILLIHPRAFIRNIHDYIEGYMAQVRSQAKASEGQQPLADDAVLGGWNPVGAAVLGGQDKIARTLKDFIEFGEHYWYCPKSYMHHYKHSLLQELDVEKRMCAGLWWCDVEGGVTLSESEYPLNIRRMGYSKRKMPSFEYVTQQRPPGVKPQYVPAIFASFPCTGLAVVRSQNNKHLKSLAKARQAQLEVIEVDQ